MENKVINVQMDEETFKKFQNIDVPTEGGGSGVEADDLFYYMSNTADKPMFIINLNTGELVEATSSFESESFRDWYYSIDGDTISVRDPGYDFYYGIGTQTQIIENGEEKTAYAMCKGYGYTRSELQVTKIGKWNFKLLQ